MATCEHCKCCPERSTRPFQRTRDYARFLPTLLVLYGLLWLWVLFGGLEDPDLGQDLRLVCC